MSEQLAMEVGKALSQSERAIDRADEAFEKAHKTAGFMQTLENKMGDHARRIAAVEEEQATMKDATEKLALSVDRLTAKLPPPKSATQITREVTREVWKGTSTKGKAGLVAVIVAILSAPEVLKELGAALGRLLARLG